MRALRAIMNVALRWTLIKENPFSRVQLCKIPKTTPKFLSRNDFKKLIDIVEELWLKEIIIFAILTGLRRAEITNLKWTNVDFTRKVISIESNQTFIVKSGRKRVVPLNEMVFQMLESKYQGKRTELVFALIDKKIMDDWVTRLFKWYVRKACLDDKLKFHSLRASFASWFVMDGVPIYAVSKLLGHSEVSITQKHYAYLAPENLHNEINRISIPK
jgi:integrase